MSGPDWYRWYPAKYASGVIGLNPEQRGVYMDVINTILDRGECPEDYSWLAKVCNCRADKARRIVAQLVEKGKLQRENGNLLQKKAQKEREESEKFSELQAKRAHSRWAKARNINDMAHAINGHAITTTTTEETPSHGRPVGDLFGESESSTSIGPSPPAKARRKLEYPAEFEEFWASYTPKRGSDTKVKAFEAWTKAQRQHGVTPDELLDGAKRTAAYLAATAGEPCHVATWMNQQRWTASYAIPTAGNGGHHQHRKLTSRERDLVVPWGTGGNPWYTGEQKDELRKRGLWPVQPWMREQTTAPQ